MRRTRIKRHTIAEWEESVKGLPFQVELQECLLTDGLVDTFYGSATVGNKLRRFCWDERGRCWHGTHRISQYDIHFNTPK